MLINIWWKIYMWDYKIITCVHVSICIYNLQYRLLLMLLYQLFSPCYKLFPSLVSRSWYCSSYRWLGNHPEFLPLLPGQSPSSFISESAWEFFVINLLTFVLSGHVIGSCWYLLGLQVIIGAYNTKKASHIYNFF